MTGDDIRTSQLAEVRRRLRNTVCGNPGCQCAASKAAMELRSKEEVLSERGRS